MAVRGVWYSPDRTLRVELVDERGRSFYRVIRNGFPVAAPGSREQLARWLRDNAGVAVDDLVED